MLNISQFLAQNSELIQQLKQDFQYLTEDIMKKTMQHANKQLQDTLMNYFLENYVSTLLRKNMQKDTNRAVKEELNLNLPQDQPKYMGLLINFEQKLELFQKGDDYEQLLTQLLIDSDHYTKFSENWKTHTRKRILALLLLVHWKLPEQRQKLDSFFELWKICYPDSPLPQRIIKKKVRVPPIQTTKEEIGSEANQKSTQQISDNINSMQQSCEQYSNKPRKLLKQDSQASQVIQQSINQLPQIKKEEENNNMFFYPYNPFYLYQPQLLCVYPQIPINFQQIMFLNQYYNSIMKMK